MNKSSYLYLKKEKTINCLCFFTNNTKYDHYSFYFETFMKTSYKVLCDTFQSLIACFKVYSSNPSASLLSNFFTICSKLSKSESPTIKLPPLLSTYTALGKSFFMILKTYLLLLSSMFKVIL